MRGFHAPQWLLFYGGILAAWLMLFLMAFSAPERAFSRIYGAEFWGEICAVDVADAGFSGVILMWLLMSAAMMAPTFVPSLRVFADLSHKQQGKGFGALITGYLLVWAGFSVLAALLQMWLAGQGWLMGDRISVGWLNAGVLFAAGLYQFTALKDACLSKCRAPLTFFMQYWAKGPLNMGLRLGLVCVGCCWALMLLGFVGGVMNLLWMGLATLLMVLEKLPEIGRYVTRPLGVILIFSAAIVALV